MSKTVNNNKTPTIRKRKGYLIPIEGCELEGPISRGFKYVRIKDWDYSKERFSHSPIYYKKVRVLGCSYCGEESHYTAIFPHSGYETIERLCQKCVKIYRAFNDSPRSSFFLGDNVICR